MYERLRQLGWSDTELDYLRANYAPRQEATGLVFGAFALLLVASAIVPYTYGRIGWILTEGVFVVTLLFIAFPLGAAFGLLLTDFDRLQNTHHVFALVALPLLVLAISVLLFSLANAHAPPGALEHNALIAGIVYMVAFMTPYAFLVRQSWN